MLQLKPSVKLRRIDRMYTSRIEAVHDPVVSSANVANEPPLAAGATKKLLNTVHAMFQKKHRAKRHISIRAQLRSQPSFVAFADVKSTIYCLANLLLGRALS